PADLPRAGLTETDPAAAALRPQAGGRSLAGFFGDDRRGLRPVRAGGQEASFLHEEPVDGTTALQLSDRRSNVGKERQPAAAAGRARGASPHGRYDRGAGRGRTGPP